MPLTSNFLISPNRANNPLSSQPVSNKRPQVLRTTPGTVSTEQTGPLSLPPPDEAPKRLQRPASLRTRWRAPGGRAAPLSLARPSAAAPPALTLPAKLNGAAQKYKDAPGAADSAPRGPVARGTEGRKCCPRASAAPGQRRDTQQGGPGRPPAPTHESKRLASLRQTNPTQPVTQLRPPRSWGPAPLRQVFWKPAVLGSTKDNP